MRILAAKLSALIVPVAVLINGCGAGDEELILGATTSVQDPGLLDELVEEFEDRYDYNVKPVVGGSGQILEQARRGEMDVIMTHSPADEETLVVDGYGSDRTEVMRNFFWIAGPHDDPAGVADADTLAEAFEAIANATHGFVSRGDNSGTHRREQATWDAAGIDPVGEGWYTESATGQGQNLLVANDNDAYTLVDSSTFISFEDRLQIVALFRDDANPNVYSVVRLNGEILDQVNAGAADDWLEFITGAGQHVIAEYGREEYGQPLFEPLRP